MEIEAAHTTISLAVFVVTVGQVTFLAFEVLLVLVCWIELPT